jgi:serine/threonine protein kinase
MLLKQKEILFLLWNCKNNTKIFISNRIDFILFRISGGELFERVIDDDFILTERLCELYMMQICEGVSFMHSCNIIHLDMKVYYYFKHSITFCLFFF